MFIELGDFMDVIQIGNGKIARIHRRNLPRGSKVIALVVRNKDLNERRIKKDPTIDSSTPVYTSIEEAFDSTKRPYAWDIVSDDHTHYMLLRKILSYDSEASVIVGKSPISIQKIRELYSILESHPKATITLTENYVTSNVLAGVRELAREYECDGDAIIDFTKNRARDMADGRFEHHDTKVLGYEGTHMITVLHALGKMPERIEDVKLTDLNFPDGKVLSEQGSGRIIFKNKDGSYTDWYVGMNGKIFYRDKALPKFKDVPYGNQRRYRIVVVRHKTKNLRVLGQFEPVAGLKRDLGRIFVIENDKVIRKEIVPENTIKETLKQQFCLVGGTCEDYFPKELVHNFTILQKAYDQWKETVLGSKERNL